MVSPKLCRIEEKTMWFSPTPNTIEAKRTKLVQKDTAADGVIGTAMKSCIHRHPTHLDQKPLRPPKRNNAVLVWSSFGGLRGLWPRWVRCLWIQLFIAVPMTSSAAVSDIDGRRYRRFSPILGSSPPPWRPLFLSPAKKIIADVVVTGDNWKSLIHENLTSKISCQTPFTVNIEAKRTVLAYNLSRSKQKWVSPKFSKIENETNCLFLKLLRSKRKRPGCSKIFEERSEAKGISGWAINCSIEIQRKRVFNDW